MYDELQWRLVSIERVLDRLPMHAARWPALDDLYRTDVRLEWGSALDHIDHLHWYFRRYSRGEPWPDWYVMLGLRVEEAEPMLCYMELRRPRAFW